MIFSYCNTCNAPITEEEVNMGTVVKTKLGNRYEHFYHTQAAQDILKDKEYMDAVGVFIAKMGELAKTEAIDKDLSKKIAIDLSQEKGLDFDTLEIAIKAFYSFAIAESTKGEGNEDKSKKDG